MNAFSLEWIGTASERLLTAPMSINGETARFILDTGAAATMIHPRLAKRLALEPTESTTGQGAGGTVTIDIAMAKSLNFAGLEWTEQVVCIMPELHNLETKMGALVDGIVGFPMFNAHTLWLDVDRMAGGLSDERITEGTSHNASEGQPFLHAVAKIGGKAVNVLVDTAASATDLSQDLAQELGLELSDETEMYGAGGSIVSASAKNVHVEFALKEATLDVSVSGYHKDLGETIGLPIDAILGLDFLGRHRMEIDYVSKLIRLS